MVQVAQVVRAAAQAAVARRVALRWGVLRWAVCRAAERRAAACRAVERRAAACRAVVDPWAVRRWVVLPGPRCLAMAGSLVTTVWFRARRDRWWRHSERRWRRRRQLCRNERESWRQQHSSPGQGAAARQGLRLRRAGERCLLCSLRLDARPGGLGGAARTPSPCRLERHVAVFLGRVLIALVLQ